jgi:pseudouridine kinase
VKNTSIKHRGGETNPYVVVIGDATVDVMATATSTIHPYASHQCHGVYQKPGGSARNVAENLARLACTPYLISAFGDDSQGRSLMDLTYHAGVDLSGSRVVPEMTTAGVVIVNDTQGENFCMIGDDSITAALTPEWLESQTNLLQNAALIVANTRMSEEALAWLFRHHGELPIFIDTLCMDVAERIRPWLPLVHTIKPNRAEAHHLSGLPFSIRSHAPAIADWFIQQGIAQVVLSLGEFGLYYSNGEQADWLEALPVNVVDVTGAGDALMAGLAYSWLNALSFPDAAHFANGCAALTVTTRDNNHPHLSRATVQGIL